MQLILSKHIAHQTLSQWLHCTFLHHARVKSVTMGGSHNNVYLKRTEARINFPNFKLFIRNQFFSHNL